MVPKTPQPTTMTKKETNDSSRPTKVSSFDALTPAVQFAVLAAGVIFFFSIHNVLQEAMMKIPGFNFGVMLGYMEVVG